MSEDKKGVVPEIAERTYETRDDGHMWTRVTWADGHETEYRMNRVDQIVDFSLELLEAAGWTVEMTLNGDDINKGRPARVQCQAVGPWQDVEGRAT